MKNAVERELIREYNKAYSKILHVERKKRKLTLEKLAFGIMSRSKLEDLEKSNAQWTKLEGDTLMLRMGILPEYFESLASGKELEQWRLREDICLLVPGHPEEAAAAINNYRKRCKKRECLEEQFLLKAEVILMLTRQGAPGGEASELILDKAMQAVSYTIKDEWMQGLDSFCLSPGELEAVLLVCAALFENGRKAEAWRLWEAVWDYPGSHKWMGRARALIRPQTMILGIRMASASNEELSAAGVTMAGMAARGQETLELLRENHCHCHVLPLLDCLCDLDASFFVSEYRNRMIAFREAFRNIYEWINYPGYRMWQGSFVDNTRDAGITLKMLRTFYGKSRESAIYDGDDLVITSRQLERIEKGLHKPSFQNYDRLTKQYGKFEGWNVPLLETDSLEVLEQRQLISSLLECDNWELANWEIQKFRRKVNPAFPKVKQELLFFDAVLKMKKNGDLQECLDMLKEALRCTVPDFEGRDMKWWVYQREEIMMASNIGSLYRKLGNLEEAKRWLESVLFSIRQNSIRTGIYHYGHDVAFGCYDNYLCDIRCFDDIIKMGEHIISKSLMLFTISNIQELFYRIARNAREIAAEKPEEYESLRPTWEKAFRISKVMAEFMYDSSRVTFLSAQESK